MALVKDTKVTERARVQFGAEACNAFNNVNFSLPINVLTGTAFGQITSAGSPDILQFALKLCFEHGRINACAPESGVWSHGHQ